LNTEEFVMSNSTAAQLQRGVIVEFDFAVLSGHAFLLDICRTRLAKEGVTLDATLMARSMGGKTFSSGLNALCNRQQKTIEVPSVIAECYEQYAEALKGALPAVPAGFIDFVKSLLGKGMKVVLVSRADSEAVRAVFAAVQTEKLVVMHDTSAGFGFCSWDGWRRAARKNDLHERLCVAVAGSGYSVKGALTSGLGVMSKVNPLTEYQDVSGCDVHVSEFSAALADEVVRILRV
jgi:beta-phosphoglucomutase-like phosphatase (HAD superfamily)